MKCDVFHKIALHPSECCFGLGILESSTGLVVFNLAQVTVIWEEGTSVEKLPPSDLPLDKSVGTFS